jgi:hypothetical protein
VRGAAWQREARPGEAGQGKGFTDYPNDYEEIPR